MAQVGTKSFMEIVPNTEDLKVSNEFFVIFFVCSLHSRRVQGSDPERPEPERHDFWQLFVRGVDKFDLSFRRDRLFRASGY